MKISGGLVGDKIGAPVSILSSQKTVGFVGLMAQKLNECGDNGEEEYGRCGERMSSE